MSTQSPEDSRSVTRVSLQNIRFDPLAWPRQRVDEERVALFAGLYEERGPDALPPLEAVDVGGELLLSDGVTRARAAIVAGLEELPVVIIRAPEGEDPILFAFLRAVRASTGGHKELTRAERQAGIRRLIEETKLEDSEIAGLFGVDRATVWRHRQRVANATDDRPEAAGELYYATVTAEELARRFFKAIEKVREARGLGVWDVLTRDHTGHRLAKVLREVYGNNALKRAEAYRTWIDEAITSLKKGSH